MNPPPAAARTFACAVTVDGRRCVIEPLGDIDLAARPRLDDAVARIHRGIEEVRVDFTGVPFMDSSGAGFLYRLGERCREAGARLRIDGLQAQPRRLCTLLALTVPGDPVGGESCGHGRPAVSVPG